MWKCLEIGVAPFVGAWIEMTIFACGCIVIVVAPFVGAWIEITQMTQNYSTQPSHLS